MKPLLEIENLSLTFARYGRGGTRTELPALQDLSLTVEPGQVAALVGSSGAGKSLLAHAVLHILPPNCTLSGRMLYEGTPLTARRAARLRGREIALVPQGVTYLDPMMPVGPQVRRGRQDRDTRQRCRDTLARYDLGPETEEMYPFQLSGGMARRVLIACAVMDRPRLVVADEPTPGLDARAAGRVLDHFRELAQEGAGVLFITHDLELAVTVADKIVVMHGGRTVEEASAGSFRSGHGLSHPYSRALWQAMPGNAFCSPEREGAVL